MIVDIIDNYDRFEKLRDNWEEVYALDHEAQFFLSWIWLSQLFQRRPESWSVLAARTDESQAEYVAFFPLRPRTRYSASAGEYIDEVYMGGNFWADYTGLICDPGHDAQAIPAFADHLKSQQWAKLHLEYICASEKRLSLLINAFDTSRFKILHRNRTSKVDGIDNLISPFIQLPDSFDEYLSRHLSANTRQKIRRFERRLDSRSDLSISPSTPETRTKDLEAFARFWTVKWAERKGKKVDTLARKYSEILDQGLDSEIVYMPVLRESGRPVAMLASFVDKQKKTLLYFVAGRDVSWSELPAGVVLHAHNVRWAIKNGFTTYDLLRGNEGFKYSLGAVDRHIDCIRIETRDNRNLYGRLDPGSAATVVRDLPRRLSKIQSPARRRVCRQVLVSWPQDTDVLQQSRAAFRRCGDRESVDQITRAISEAASGD